MMTVCTYVILNVLLVNLEFAQCSQQVNHFKYLGCQISYENEEDIQQIRPIFAQILEILNNSSKPSLVQKFIRI
jgi:hypothetical protein